MKHIHFHIALLLLSLAFSTNALAQSYRMENDTARSLPPVPAWQRYFSTADHYMEVGDTAFAIVYYQKALQLNNTDTTRWNELEQIKRCYMKPARSFYLKSEFNP